MGDEEEEEIPLQQDISVKINPIRRLCREAFCPLKDMERRGGGARSRDNTTRDTEEEDCVVACPVVLRQLCNQIRVQSRNKAKKTAINLQTIHNLLSSRPYWRRCLCSPSALPAITEKELVLLLSLTPAHRFIVLVVTSAVDSLGSVVVGGESLIQAVYAAQNLPCLRPCLQTPSKPSIAFIKYQLTKPKSKKKDRKAAPSTILNNGQVKVGMVLIYQKTTMLYAGFPLASYGCSRHDFLTFISKYTQYDFCLRTPEIEQSSRSESPEPGKDDVEDSPEESTL